MNEAKRHRLILRFPQDRPFASARDLQQVVRASPAPGWLAWRPFPEDQMLGVGPKKTITETERP